MKTRETVQLTDRYVLVYDETGYRLLVTGDGTGVPSDTNIAMMLTSARAAHEASICRSRRCIELIEGALREVTATKPNPAPWNAPIPEPPEPSEMTCLVDEDEAREVPNA
jgi:hypothetical protein